MRILYIVQHFSGPGGSSSVRAYEAAVRLVHAGHAVTVLCGSFEKASERDFAEAQEAGVRIVRSPIHYGQRMSTPQRLLAFRRYMNWATAVGTAQPRPDVVFASSTPLTIGEVGRRVARHHRVPFVFEVRDLWPEVPMALGALQNPLLRWSAKRMARKVYAAADHVVALSPDMADGVMRWGVAAERVTVIPNCSSNELFGDRSERDAVRAEMGWAGKFVAIHAGSLGKVNNIEYLLDAAAALRHLDAARVHVAIVGDGAVRDAVAARIARQRLTHVGLYPAVANARMPRLLSAADCGLVTVLPIKELEANSANKFFDCLAAGLPVALNYGGWQATTLNRAGAGEASSPQEPAAMAALLARWSSDSALVTRMGTAARTLAEGQFDRGRLVTKLEAVLHSLVGRGSDADKVSARNRSAKRVAA
jgi:glycosyltransferase involved in cell wall biosynthesis